MEVREVAPAEYEAAGRVVVAAYTALPGAHMSDGYATELADVSGRVRGAVVLVALDEGDLWGCITYVPGPESPWAEQLEPGEAGIRMLGVDPAAQGRGAGAALVAACVTRARVQRRRAVVLHSTPWMLGAHRVYERAGFARLPERDWVPVPEVPLLAFRLDLA